jgi:hypothetical protein
MLEIRSDGKRDEQSPLTRLEITENHFDEDVARRHGQKNCSVGERF